MPVGVLETITVESQTCGTNFMYTSWRSFVVWSCCWSQSWIDVQ